MKKEVVTEDNYKQIVLKRMIIICWVILFVCFIIKIFGGNFFNIVCTNTRFANICAYVDKAVWIQYIIGCISTFLLHSMYLLAISKKLWFSKRDLLFVIPSILIGVGLRLINNIVGYFVDVWQYFVLPLFIENNFHKNVYARRIALGFALTFIFQLISIVTKNLSIMPVTNNCFLIAIIYFIDIYIMVILYYLYSNLKENNMGLLGGWLWGKNEKQLKALKEKKLAQIEALKKDIADIDAKLAQPKEENK